MQRNLVFFPPRISHIKLITNLFSYKTSIHVPQNKCSSDPCVRITAESELEGLQGLATLLEQVHEQHLLLTSPVMRDLLPAKTACSILAQTQWLEQHCPTERDCKPRV